MHQNDTSISSYTSRILSYAKEMTAVQRRLHDREVAARRLQGVAYQHYEHVVHQESVAIEAHLATPGHAESHETRHVTLANESARVAHQAR